MGKLKNLLIETDEEREVFERMKAKCSICGGTDCTHQVQFMSISVDDYLKLSEELAVARMLIRELGDRLSNLEGERNFCPRCGKRLVDGSIHTCTPPQEKTA